MENISKKQMTKQFIQENRDELRELYNSTRPQNKKLRHLTKKERKELGIGRDQGIATQKNVRMSPVKANLVCRLIKGKDLDEAYAILQYTPRAVAPILAKLLKSAESNAVNNNELSRDSLYVESAIANPGPVLKRMRPRGRGSANRELKRTTHLTVVVKERK